MASQHRNRATSRTYGLSEKSYASEHNISANLHGRDGGPLVRGTAGFGATLPAFDRLPESYVDPQLIRENSTNIEHFSNLETYPTPTSADGSGVLTEDYTTTNSFSYEELPELFKPVPYQNATDTQDEVGQDQIFGVTSGPDQYDYHHLYRSMGDSIALTGSQTLLRSNTGPDMPITPFQYAGRDSAASNGSIDYLQGLINTDMSSPQRPLEDSVRQLECNYIFTPHPTEEEIKALSILVKLTPDQVQEFYRKKNPSALTHLTRASQVVELQNIPNPAKRHRGSNLSSFEFPASTYGNPQKDLAIRPRSCPKNAIPRVSSLGSSSRKSSQKPYFCTWRACHSSFSSKSDWKRHEEVHAPQWLWVCTFDREESRRRRNTTPCTRRFKRDDHLREHLKSHHNCTESQMVMDGREILEPKSPFNSQCGFCGLYTPEWPDRINHIAEHFKTGKHISDWKDPWLENTFNTGFNPISDDDDPDTDQSGTHNPTSDKANESRAKPGGNNQKGHSNAPGDGRYQSSSTKYCRPGIFGVKYRSRNHSLRVVALPKPHYDPLIIEKNEPLSPFWRQMRCMFKHMAIRRGTSSASVSDTNKVNSKAATERERQSEERIEFYCILCLKITPTDSSLRSSDEYHCTCSEAAIQDHVWSLIGADSSPPNETKSEDGGRLEQKKPKTQLDHAAPGETLERDVLFKRHLLHAIGGVPVQDSELKRLATMNDDQLVSCTDADADSLSHSMNRCLKLRSSAEGDSEWIEIPGGGKSLRNSPPASMRLVG